MSPRHIDRSSPYFRARMMAPPAGARFDAVFVHAVGQLAAQVHESRSDTEGERS